MVEIPPSAWTSNPGAPVGGAAQREGRAAKNILAKIPRNPLKRLISDEGIKEIQELLAEVSRRKGEAPRKSKRSDRTPAAGAPPLAPAPPWRLRREREPPFGGEPDERAAESGAVGSPLLEGVA